MVYQVFLSVANGLVDRNVLPCIVGEVEEPSRVKANVSDRNVLPCILGYRHSRRGPTGLTTIVLAEGWNQRTNHLVQGVSHQIQKVYAKNHALVSKQFVASQAPLRGPGGIGNSLDVGLPAWALRTFGQDSGCLDVACGK